MTDRTGDTLARAKGRRAARDGGRDPHEKVAVSVPSHLLRAAREQVRAGQRPSVSAVFADALAHELEDQGGFERLVEGMLASGELQITDDDRAWARQALGR